MKISQNKFLNRFYLFTSGRRWLRRLHLINMPDIGFYSTNSGFTYAVALNDWRGPSYHLIKWGEKTYEPENKKSLLAFIPENEGVFLDIGANIGLFSFHFTNEKKGLTAHLFEPEPVANECLKQTISLNNIKKFEVHSLALSDKEKTTTFFVDGKNFGGHSLVETNILSEGDNVSDKMTVKTTTLDLFVQEKKLPEIHAIKIDVQGHEYEVLSGAVGTLKKYKPVLLVECYFREICSDKSILKLFENSNDFFIFEPRTKKIYTLQELYNYSVERSKQDHLSFSDFLFIPDTETNKRIAMSI